MNAFLTWLQSLGWRDALCFLLLLCIGACVLICGTDLAIRKFAAWLEQRAIAKRDWAVRKERVQLILDAQRERERREANDAQFLRRLNIDIANDDAQKNREVRQFHIPAAFRDMKGTQR